MVKAKQQPVSRTGEMVLAILGGVFGIFGGLFAVFIGSLQTVGEGEGMNVGILGWSAIAFSVLAIVSAFYANSRAKLAGWLLVVAAIGGLVSISFFFILPFILIIIAGLMCLLRGRQAKKA